MVLLVLSLITFDASAAPTPPQELQKESRSCYAVWQGLSLNRRQGGTGGVTGMAEKGCQAHIDGGLVELSDVRLKVAVKTTERGQEKERTLFITSPTGLIAKQIGDYRRDQIAVSSAATITLDGTPLAHNGLVVDFLAGEARSSNGLRFKLL